MPYVGISKTNGYNLMPLNQLLDQSKDCIPGPLLPLSIPHSVAFVDLNKDCVADLFLTTQDSSGNLMFEVLLNNHDGGYCRVYQEAAPSGARQVSFADVGNS